MKGKDGGKQMLTEETRKEIKEKLESSYSDYEVRDISRDISAMPFGAYIYAYNKVTGERVQFYINF